MAFGVVAFVAALLVSVLLHEAGHFVTARAFGMKATQFFAGFGPTLWSFRRGETEYGVKAIPAGGFVKIVGMTALEPIDPADEPRAFYRQKPWQRTIVLGAGSFMHFVIAFLLFWLIIGFVGLNRPSLTVDSLSSCVPVHPTSETCAAHPVAAPAKVAGFKPGDRITALNGHRVAGWDDFTEQIRALPGRQVEVTVQRAGRSLTLVATPVAADRPDPDDDSKVLHGVGFLGLSPADENHRRGLIGGFTGAGSAFGQSIGLTFAAFGKLPGEVANAFKPDRSALDSPQSVVGVSRNAGQTLAGGGTATHKLVTFLLLVAAINLFVGIFNLLPLLPLDGGHLAILWFEQARTRLARLFGRPDPGRVDLAKVMPVAYAFVSVLIGLSLALLWADIVNPASLPY